MDRTNSASPFVVEPTPPHTHTHSFILLHGLGSRGDKFGPELLETGICSDGRKLNEVFPGAKFIFPTSKTRRSSAFGRAKLTQWFNIASLDDPWRRQDTQLSGLAESAEEILNLIKDEVQNVSPRNIILGGLSQGCAMALSLLLALDFPIGAFIGMSGWLPFQHDIQEAIKNDEEAGDSDNPFASDHEDPSSTPRDPIVEVNRFSRDLLCLAPTDDPTKETTAVSTPVFIGHGDSDEKVKPSFGDTAAKTLELVGFKVTWKSYEGQGHWYKIPDEIDDIVEFLEGAVGRGGIMQG
ncbi:acyl-protein thioesterase [Xylariaceae sp. FL0804]|nr:acyl-protein thioesterase [Xylariaceae sp. FL0804]